MLFVGRNPSVGIYALVLACGIVLVSAGGNINNGKAKSVENDRNKEVLAAWAPELPDIMSPALKEYFGKIEQDDCHKHVAVVGAGPVGLLTALMTRHTMPKACVTVLEKRPVLFRNEEGQIRFNPDQARMQTVLLRIEIATILSALPISDRLANEAKLPSLRSECLSRVSAVDPATFKVAQRGIDSQKDRRTHTVWELLVCGHNSPAVLIDQGSPIALIPDIAGRTGLRYLLRGEDAPRTIIGLSIIYLQTVLAAVATEPPYAVPVICDRDVVSVTEVDEQPSIGYRVHVKGEMNLSLFAHVVFGAEGKGNRGSPVANAASARDGVTHMSDGAESRTADAVSQVRTYLLPRAVSDLVSTVESSTWRSLATGGIFTGRSKGLEIARLAPQTFLGSLYASRVHTVPNRFSMFPESHLRFERRGPESEGNVAARIFITPYPGYPAGPDNLKAEDYDILYVGLALPHRLANTDENDKLVALHDDVFRAAVNEFFRLQAPIHKTIPIFLRGKDDLLDIGKHLVEMPDFISTRAKGEPWQYDGLDYVPKRRAVHSQASPIAGFPALFIVGDSAMEPLFILASGMNTGSVNALISVHEAKSLLFGDGEPDNESRLVTRINDAFREGDTAFAVLARTTMVGIHEVASRGSRDVIDRSSSLRCISAVKRGRISAATPRLSCASPELPNSLFVSTNMNTLSLNNEKLNAVARGESRNEGGGILSPVTDPRQSIPVRVYDWVRRMVIRYGSKGSDVDEYPMPTSLESIGLGWVRIIRNIVKGVAIAEKPSEPVEPIEVRFDAGNGA